MDRRLHRRVDLHLTEVHPLALLARHRTMAIHRVLVTPDRRRRTSTADLRYTKWARIMLVLADTAQDRAAMAPALVAMVRALVAMVRVLVVMVQVLVAMDLAREAMATVDTEVVLAMEVAQTTEVVPITEAVPIMEVVHMAVVLTMALAHMDQVKITIIQFNHSIFFGFY